MTTLNKLQGKQFTNLLVLNYIGDNNWKCRCKCGNTINANTLDLMVGKVKSCGCPVSSFIQWGKLN